MPLFHCSLPVTNLDSAREFYGKVFGCTEGRSTESWIDFDLFGHQLSVHIGKPVAAGAMGTVADIKVPIPHFGPIIGWDEFWNLAEKLKGLGKTFEVEPYVRYQGEAGEQATMFLLDPDRNAWEFKAFKNPDEIFKKQ